MNGSASLIVVSYNSRHTLPDCLAAALAAPECAEVVVVDNGSSDGSLEWLAEQQEPRLKLLPQGKNLGFGAACNRGAAVAQGAVLVLVNPDCALMPGALAALLAALQPHQGRALAGAVLFDAEGIEDLRNLARHDPSPGRLLSAAVRGQSSIAEPVSLDPAAPPQPVSNVSGALMAIGAALFRDLGGFDEGYFLHVEDLDLCRRVRAAGAPVLLVAAARARHLKGGASGGHALRVLLHKHRGLLRYYRKFDREGSNTLVRLLFPALIWLRMLLLAPVAWLRDRRPR